MPTAEALRTAENELERLRRLVADLVAVIHNPAYDYDTRRAIALAIGLPTPTPEKP